MSVITYQGTVEQGRVKLSDNIHLPEKAKVFVILPDFQDDDSKPKFNLAEIVARMPADYQVSEVDFGRPVGKEEW